MKGYHLYEWLAAKVIENIQRDLNIALINELAVIFNKLGLNSREIIDAAEEMEF